MHPARDVRSSVAALLCVLHSGACLRDRVSRSSGKRIANMCVPGIISAIKRTEVSLLPPRRVTQYHVYALEIQRVYNHWTLSLQVAIYRANATFRQYYSYTGGDNGAARFIRKKNYSSVWVLARKYRRFFQI